MDKLKKILESLGISRSAQEVYLSLISSGEATAHMLAKRTGITRPSVYDQLKELRAKDLVAERAVDGTTFFAPSDIRRLDAMLEERIESLHSDREILTETLPMLLKQTRGIQPKIRFFEGQKGVQQMMKDILWSDDVSLNIFWPYTQMLDILGVDFLKWFNERRITHKIAIRTIWPNDPQVSKNNIFAGSDLYVTRRYARNNQSSDMGYLAYDDKTAFVSSTKEAFGAS
jgi:sugar-specific transcriptional regulator TrmB